jgi:hypothetical protein
MKQFFPTNVPKHSAAELHSIATEASKQALIAALALAATLSHPPQASNLYYYPITTSAISSHDNPAQTSSLTFSTQTASYYIAKNDCSHWVSKAIDVAINPKTNMIDNFIFSSIFNFN